MFKNVKQLSFAADLLCRENSSARIFVNGNRALALGRASRSYKLPKKYRKAKVVIIGIFQLEEITLPQDSDGIDYLPLVANPVIRSTTAQTS